MIQVDVVLLPSQLAPEMVAGRAVAVFDVLRATTTMTAALAAGVAQISLFPSIEAAQEEARGLDPRPLLAGERNCVRPEEFDLGNSPVEMDRAWPAGQALFMATTNGTRAIIAARQARALIVAALVNAEAAGRALLETGLDVTLLCAGTNGEVALEDVLGAGAVIEAMRNQRGVRPASDRALMAERLFAGAKDRLREVLEQSAGGRNVIAAGLSADIDFAASLNRYPIVGRVDGERLRVAL